MARKNKKGTSYLGLGLEKNEEKDFKKILGDKPAKQVFRELVRRIIKKEVEI